MAREQLFNFVHDREKIFVFTGESSSDVYYQKGNGSTRSTGLKWNSETGNFKTASGATMKFKDATAHVRSLLDD